MKSIGSPILNLTLFVLVLGGCVHKDLMPHYEEEKRRTENQHPMERIEEERKTEEAEKEVLTHPKPGLNLIKEDCSKVETDKLIIPISCKREYILKLLLQCQTTQKPEDFGVYVPLRYKEVEVDIEGSQYAPQRFPMKIQTDGEGGISLFIKDGSGSLGTVILRRGGLEVKVKESLFSKPVLLSSKFCFPKTLK